MNPDKLFFELPVGLRIGDEVHKDVELLRTNGVAEKIITAKIIGKPHTWQANVLCAAVKKIGPYEIGVKAREEYLKTGAITIPEAIQNLTLADQNTILVEIHRRVWKTPLIKEQEILCKYCTDKLKGDIDLNEIDFSEEDKVFMGTNPDLSQILVYLPTGFTVGETVLASQSDFQPFTDTIFNKLTYRPPLVKDALLHEKYAKEEVEFWRRLAGSCLVDVQAVANADTVEEQVLAELPKVGIKLLGQSLYDIVLDTNDLGKIREELQEFLPTLPFHVMGKCGCSKQYDIPYVMEGTSFF